MCVSVNVCLCVCICLHMYIYISIYVHVFPLLPSYVLLPCPLLSSRLSPSPSLSPSPPFLPFPLSVLSTLRSSSFVFLLSSLPLPSSTPLISLSLFLPFPLLYSPLPFLSSPLPLHSPLFPLPSLSPSPPGTNYSPFGASQSSTQWHSPVLLALLSGIAMARERREDLRSEGRLMWYLRLMNATPREHRRRRRRRAPSWTPLSVASFFGAEGSRVRATACVRGVDSQAADSTGWFLLGRLPLRFLCLLWGELCDLTRCSFCFY